MQLHDTSEAEGDSETPARTRTGATPLQPQQLGTPYPLQPPSLPTPKPIMLVRPDSPSPAPGHHVYHQTQGQQGQHHTHNATAATPATTPLTETPQPTLLSRTAPRPRFPESLFF